MRKMAAGHSTARSESSSAPVPWVSAVSVPRNGAHRPASASMSKESLEKQADRADNLADQVLDAVLQETLRDAAREYRQKAKAPVYALFKGQTQLTGTYPSEKELMKALSNEGLIPELKASDKDGSHVLPEGYRIEQVKQIYDPQPD
jgi:hypothetical protein